jgi:uncharacterized glyoxalase superfamily protein PhnB
MFQEAFPILTVADMQATLAFYCGQLEFTKTFRFPDQGDPVYVGLELGSSRLGIGADQRALTEEGRPPAIDRPFDLWVYADDCDAASMACNCRELQVVEEPADQPWGERIARVNDPDGNRVIVATRTD